MHCLKSESEKQQENESEKPQEEPSRLSIHIPITSSEVESQSQHVLDEEREEVVEDYSIDQPSFSDYQLARDRERRPRRLPQILESNFDLAYASYQELADKEPNTYKEAIRSEYSKEWVEVMKEEMSSPSKNHTWELVPKSKNKFIIGCKWIYQAKEGTSKSEPIRFKARLVAKGFTQKEGVDYNEIFLLLLSILLYVSCLH